LLLLSGIESYNLSIVVFFCPARPTRPSKPSGDVYMYRLPDFNVPCLGTTAVPPSTYNFLASVTGCKRAFDQMFGTNLTFTNYQPCYLLVPIGTVINCYTASETFCDMLTVGFGSDNLPYLPLDIQVVAYKHSNAFLQVVAVPYTVDVSDQVGNVWGQTPINGAPVWT